MSKVIYVACMNDEILFAGDDEKSVEMALSAEKEKVYQQQLKYYSAVISREDFFNQVYFHIRVVKWIE